MKTPTTTEKAEAQTAEVTARHTPGPWTIGAYPEAKDGFRYTISRNGRGWWIAAVTNGPAEEQSANAHLIAAAPELLEALRSVADAYQQMFDVMPVAFQTYAHIVDAAIAKAEGRVE